MRLYFILSISILFALTHQNIFARTVSKQGRFQKKVETSLVVDAETGKILHAERADKVIHPASLTKLMTLYLTFDALDKKQITMDQKLPVSKHAASMPAMKLGLKAGENITVRDAILSIVTRSANDASVVLAEKVGSGKESVFISRMNSKARELGMKNTYFKNPTGLPDWQQKSTAIDMAKLAIALKRDHPKYYKLFATTDFTYKGKKLYSHNRVTKSYPGAEGLKTGYTNASGFNLVSTAYRSGKRLVGVVIGSNSAAVRDTKMKKLLDKHFSSVNKKPVRLSDSSSN